jgi:hypothetical protein
MAACKVHMGLLLPRKPLCRAVAAHTALKDGASIPKTEHRLGVPVSRLCTCRTLIKLLIIPVESENTPISITLLISSLASKLSSPSTTLVDVLYSFLAVLVKTGECGDLARGQDHSFPSSRGNAQC